MATAAAAADAPKGGGKKKLIIILAAVLVLVLGGGAALLLLKKKPQVDENGDPIVEEHAPAHAAPKPGTPPVFVPLDPFTVTWPTRKSTALRRSASRWRWPMPRPAT